MQPSASRKVERQRRTSPPAAAQLTAAWQQPPVVKLSELPPCSALRRLTYDWTAVALFTTDIVCFAAGFGINEHIDLGIKYDPSSGIYGMDPGLRPALRGAFDSAVAAPGPVAPEY